METYFEGVNQVCSVVKNLQKTIDNYWNKFRIGPWRIYVFEEPLIWDMTIRGRSAKYSMSLALHEMGNIMLELIQPLSGDTIYKEFLEKKGEGLHHLGIYVESLEEEIKRFEKQGIRTLQTGKYQGGGFAYLDTEDQLGTIVELIQRAKPPLTPVQVWPENLSG